MIDPGPNDDEMDAIMRAAIRVPDHGKLAPWRFITIAANQRDALCDVLTSAYLLEKPDAGRLEIESIAQFAHQAPALVIALSSPQTESKIPLWEQQLSAGAACMNLLNAVHALGFVGGWLTGWPAYSDAVRDAFGDAHERLAGFIFIGSPKETLQERPRPDPATVVSSWQA